MLLIFTFIHIVCLSFRVFALDLSVENDSGVDSVAALRFDCELNEVAGDASGTEFHVHSVALVVDVLRSADGHIRSLHGKKTKTENLFLFGLLSESLRFCGKRCEFSAAKRSNRRR